MGTTLLLLAALAVVFSVHEASHAFMATWSGDESCRTRATLNPLRHIDAIGTIALPALSMLVSHGVLLFGYAKPVAVRPEEFRKPRLGLALTAAAGPVANVLTGATAVLTWRALPDLGFITDGLLAFAVLSVFVAAFNLLPIPPLDGSKILQLCMPEPAAAWFLENGYWGLLGLGAIWAAGLVFLRVDLAERLADRTLLPILDYLLRG